MPLLTTRFINVKIRIPNSARNFPSYKLYRYSFCYNHFEVIIMTEIIINNIEKISDLAMFAESYKKGFF